MFELSNVNLKKNIKKNTIDNMHLIFVLKIKQYFFFTFFYNV